jgi:hypothetical protein
MTMRAPTRRVIENLARTELQKQRTTILNAMHSTQRDLKASGHGVSSKGSINSEGPIAEIFINCRTSWGKVIGNYDSYSETVDLTDS